MEQIIIKNYLSGKEYRANLKNNAKITKSFEKKKKRPVVEKEFLTEMKNPQNVLEIENLHTFFYTDSGTVKAVNGISFDVPENKIVGIVGESGCGKSITSLSIMQLLHAPSGQITDGSIRFRIDKEKAYEVTNMPTKAMYKIRGKDITMIFQEPMTSLNPVFTVGYQLDEVIILHENLSKEEAKAKSIKMLEAVGISIPEKFYKRYPHELSGGMRQRVMIAMALAGNPKLIIADEPTTALDVTIQAQILDLLKHIQKQNECSILLITHDLGVIAEMADYVVVMYAGRIVEKGTVEEIFHNPKHPYTIGLQKSKPLLTSDSTQMLYSIPGGVPNPINLPNECYFKSRCESCIEACSKDFPKEVKLSETHYVYCYLASEVIK